MSDFADWLNELIDREYPGWTYEAICADLEVRGIHVTRATLSRYLNGHAPSERTRRRWYSKLGAPDKKKPGEADLTGLVRELDKSLRDLRSETAVALAQRTGEHEAMTDMLGELLRRLDRLEDATRTGAGAGARPPRRPRPSQ